MERLDRLGWAAGLSFTTYGLQVGIRINRSEFLDRLTKYFPPQWRPSNSTTVDRLYSVFLADPGTRPGVRRFNLLYSNVTRKARTSELSDLLTIFGADLQHYVAENAPRRVFVHAGVVGWQDRAILIPAPSFSGKSRLVADLVHAGATYYSDEFAVLDSRGRVHAFPQPLSLRSGENTKCSQRSLELDNRAARAKPLPVGLIVITKYREGARWRPRRCSPGSAVLALLANTVSVRRQPAFALATLQQAVSAVSILKSLRGEASEIVHQILSHEKVC